MNIHLFFPVWSLILLAFIAGFVIGYITMAFRIMMQIS